jgi:hypothetical protein
MSNACYGKMDIIGLEIAYSALLNQSGVREAEVVGLRDDDVVEHSDSEDRAGTNEPLGALAILPARGRVPGGMVMLCAAPSYVMSRQGS